VKLVHGPGTCGDSSFVCPFHGWRYNAEGDCKFVFDRQLFSEALLAKAEIDLAPVRIEFWAGCAFINFDDKAPGLRDAKARAVLPPDNQYPIVLQAIEVDKSAGVVSGLRGERGCQISGCMRKIFETDRHDDRLETLPRAVGVG